MIFTPRTGRPPRRHPLAVFGGIVAVSLMAVSVVLAPTASAATDYSTFRPGQEWLDDQGEPIQGHGGQVVTAKDESGAAIYYWYGEDRSNGYAETPGVHVYSSHDLYNWTDEGLALQTMRSRDDFDKPYFAALYGDYSDAQRDAVYADLGVTSPSEGVPGAILERPKVIYNVKTEQWVMWVHADGPSSTSTAQYAKATAGVAVSDSPVGPFRYLESSRLNRVSPDDPGNAQPDNPGMARDMNLFVDDDGTGYIIYASEENLTLYISKLNSDYTDLATEPGQAVEGVDFKRPAPLIKGQREAPALFKQDGRYYLMTSGATGWAANAASYATATDLLGDWTSQGNPATGSGASNTCDTQSTSFVNLGNGRVIYLGDRWANAEDLYRAKSIWLPVSFGEGGSMTIPCGDDAWTLADLEPYRTWKVTTKIAPEAYVGNRRALPGKVSVKEKGSPATSERVSWSAGALDTVGERTVTATLADGRRFTRSVLVLPKRLRYLVNAGGANTADYKKARRFVTADGAQLLNSRPDQPAGRDPRTKHTWGYDGDTGGTYGTDAGTLSSTLRWQADGTDLRYRFGGLKPGRYRIDLGFYDPWSSSAPGRAAAVAVDGHVVVPDQIVDATYRTVSLQATVTRDGRIAVTVSPTTQYGIQLSWVMIARV